MQYEGLGRLGIFSGELAAFPADVQRRVVAELEELGYGTIWYGEAFAREPFVQGAIFLTATERMTAATGIANIYARDATAMAFGGRSLNELGGGRFLLGLGVAHVGNVTARGHEYGRPVATMRAYLDAMDAAEPRWRGPEAEPPPRVLAALRPRMLALAAERTAGAHPYFVPVEHTAKAREILGPEPILAPEQMVVLNTDRTKALEIARKGMAIYLRAPNYVNNLKRFGFTDDDIADGGSERLVDAIVATGDVDAAAKRVQQHFDAGASHVSVQVLGDNLTDVPEAAWRDLAATLT
jgi:probable F420-dependent oxidoreductase